MNFRERFCETLLFGNPDRIPLFPSKPREPTLKVWYKQGLPEGVDYQKHLAYLLNIDYYPFQKTLDPGISFRMIPAFEEKILEHKNGHYIIQDWMGAISEISDEYDYTYIRSARGFVTRRWHKFPVESREDWEKMKLRYDSSDERRYPENFKNRCYKLNITDYPVELKVNGPFWQLREWRGFENLCIKWIEEPNLIEDMIIFWTEFVFNLLTPVFDNINVDSVKISEDMAYKAHSMISPEMTRHFLKPAYDC